MAFGSNNDNENIFKMLLAQNNKPFGQNGFVNNSFGSQTQQNLQNTGANFNSYFSQNQFGNGQQQQQSNADKDNQNKEKESGGGFSKLGISPLNMALGIANSGVGIAQAVMQPKFNYGQENYTAEQAGQVEGQRASGIAKAAGSAIPVVGGVLGGIIGLIAQKIAKRKGEAKANMILGNRESHINNLEDFQMKKIQDNNFLKSSDLYKNMFNQNQLEV